MSFQPVYTSEVETLGDAQVTWEDVVQTSALFEEQHADDEQYYLQEPRANITYDMWLKMVDASERAATKTRAPNYDRACDSDGDSVPDLVEPGPDYPFSEIHYEDTFPLTYDGLMRWHQKEDEEAERIRINYEIAEGYRQALEKVLSEGDYDFEDEEAERMRLEDEEFSEAYPLSDEQLALYDRAWAKAQA
jgi:hypothetical protein